MNGAIIVNFIFTLLCFFTNINILLVIFYKHTSLFIDLHFSCLVVALVSFGITYICPREVVLQIDNKREYVFHTGSIMSYVVDIIVHWVPLVFVFMVVPISKNVLLTVRTFAYIILYLIIVQAHELYNFDIFLTVIFLVLALVARFSI